MNDQTGCTCATPGCSEIVGERSITGLCKACYSYIYINQKRSAKQLVQRARKIQLFQSRLGFLLPAQVELLNTNTVGAHAGQPQKLAVMPGQVKKWRRRSKFKKVG